MIPLSKPLIGSEEIKNITAVVTSGKLSQGKYVDLFEQEVAKYIGVYASNIIALSSGTAALHLALLACGLNNQNVHMPINSFIATANSVNYLDKDDDVSIAFDDIEPDTWNMAPHDGNKITVDLFGNPNQYKYLKDVLIEDASQAFGSIYDEKKCGVFGEYGVFSFFENKSITTGGEGGVVYVKNDDKAALIRLMRQQGKDFTMDYHKMIGYNYRMTDIQAAFGLAQLKKIDFIIKEKRRVHEMYKTTLGDIVQFQREIGRPAIWLTCIKFTSKEKRDKVRMRLKQNSVETRLPFPPIYYNPPYAGSKIYAPIAEALYNGGLILPNYPELKDDDVRKISRIIRSADVE